ncbi:zinc ribbon domain-containing protein [Haloarcula montana]|uniref:zinc ribbon domain-containing protein n=1 Tax=Haloarcula montana TaxID=3111776 RepID=UPI002D7A2DAB|nr:zinc ribbon domain-containing protein [Haloarcula sp. GH36]
MSRSPDFCPHCGEELDSVVVRCPNCRTDLGRRTDGDSSKSAGLAALLSLLITGVGHLYLGAVARGAGWFVGGIGLAVILGLTIPELSPLSFLVPVAAAVDAYTLAS